MVSCNAYGTSPATDHVEEDNNFEVVAEAADQGSSAVLEHSKVMDLSSSGRTWRVSW